jgi:hypothetical protein
LFIAGNRRTKRDRRRARQRTPAKN